MDNFLSSHAVTSLFCVRDFIIFLYHFLLPHGSSCFCDVPHTDMNNFLRHYTVQRFLFLFYVTFLFLSPVLCVMPPRPYFRWSYFYTFFFYESPTLWPLRSSLGFEPLGKLFFLTCKWMSLSAHVNTMPRFPCLTTHFPTHVTLHLLFRVVWFLPCNTIHPNNLSLFFFFYKCITCIFFNIFFKTLRKFQIYLIILLLYMPVILLPCITFTWLLHFYLLLCILLQLVNKVSL